MKKLFRGTMKWSVNGLLFDAKGKFWIDIGGVARRVICARKA